MSKVMVLLAGPNGAGKSTLFDTQIKPSFPGPFINADLIQRDELGDESTEASYEAARIAAARRDDHLDRGLSFATETVFSHPSKLDLVRRAQVLGFTVVLFHVGVKSPELSVERVKARTQEGGHPVPEDKIRARYDRSGPLIREAMLLCQQGHVFDNSNLNRGPDRIIGFKFGKVTFARSEIPNWALAIYDRDLCTVSGACRPR